MVEVLFERQLVVRVAILKISCYRNLPVKDERDRKGARDGYENMQDVREKISISEKAAPTVTGN